MNYTKECFAIYDREDGWMWNFLNKNIFYYPIVSLKTKDFFKAKRELEVSQFTPPERMQVESLQKLLFWAKENVPYYAKKLQGINPDNFSSLSDITRIPTLDKETLRENAGNIVAKKQFFMCTRKTTGGSTGQPLTILKSRRAMGYELAATWRGYSWAGIGIGDKQARFWGVPMTWRGKVGAHLTDIVCNRKRLSAFSFNEESLKQYTAQLNRFKPDYFYGYVSMLVDYADYILSNSIDLHFRPKAIVATSEVLYPEYREKLRAAFHCDRIHDEYGCGEVGTIAHECEAGSLHVSAENMIVEILKGDKSCVDGEIGEVVVTELRNYAMPLIRYRMGDFAILSTRKCSCGRKLPVLVQVKGRAYDTVTLADGKKYHGEYFMYVMEAAEKKKMGVKKFQIVQKSKKSLEVRIVPGQNFNKTSEKFIVKGIKRSLCNDIDVSIVLVDNIRREKSGKMRLIVGLQNPE